ncbi:hypothetical protein Tco_0978595 [Tanacetum coccineum]|uniref:Uncharacterized protein n=1 Tax=Tanacetum coccineum TaxID=301880 RepID=A0ABQ5ENC4_9ASTR
MTHKSFAPAVALELNMSCSFRDGKHHALKTITVRLCKNKDGLDYSKHEKKSNLGKTMETLTHHKKFVRALAKHPTEYVALLPIGLFVERVLLQHLQIILKKIALQEENFFTTRFVNKDGLLQMVGFSAKMVINSKDSTITNEEIDRIIVRG